jgi:hypothetical protein
VLGERDRRVLGDDLLSPVGPLDLVFGVHRGVERLDGFVVLLAFEVLEVTGVFGRELRVEAVVQHVVGEQPLYAPRPPQVEEVPVAGEQPVDPRSDLDDVYVEFEPEALELLALEDAELVHPRVLRARDGYPVVRPDRFVLDVRFGRRVVRRGRFGAGFSFPVSTSAVTAVFAARTTGEADHRRSGECIPQELSAIGVAEYLPYATLIICHAG